jgi:outer membrane protein assembly factor BamB
VAEFRMAQGSGDVAVAVGSRVTLYALATGRVVGSIIDQGGTVADVAIQGGRLLVTDSGGDTPRLAAYDLATTRPLWRAAIPGNPFFQWDVVATAPIALYSEVGGGLLVYGDTGRLLSRVPQGTTTGAPYVGLGVDSSPYGGPLVAGDTMILTSDASGDAAVEPDRLIAIDWRTGALLWSFDTGDSLAAVTPVAISGGRVLAFVDDSSDIARLESFAVSTGQRTTTDLTWNSYEISRDTVAVGDTAYALDAGGVEALSLTRRIIPSGE